ncbi:hypothetical protein [Fodinicola acaciae]|uniref:hypothetical protein n=1 Tax=Fodinicola acaciae TaxID=2681555 RepID=UPI0013D31F55|nr:hypothetical protein [Fodinicola acaciae]
MTSRLFAILVVGVVFLSSCTQSPPPAPASGDGVHRSAWTPARLGLVAATGDPAVMPSTPGFSAGVIYLNRVYVDQQQACNDAFIAVVNPGVGISQAYLGVYDPQSRRLLSATGDVSASLQTSAALRLPLTSMVPAQPVNKELWIAVLIGRMARSPGVIGGREYGTNLGLTDDLRLWISDRSDYTALPATAPAVKAPQHSSIPFVGIGP